MPQKQERKEPPLHKQGKLPAWEEIPVPQINDTVRKIREAEKFKEPPKKERGCGCW